jgi:hypothetical protein
MSEVFCTPLIACPLSRHGAWVKRVGRLARLAVRARTRQGKAVHYEQVQDVVAVHEDDRPSLRLVRCRAQLSACLVISPPATMKA